MQERKQLESKVEKAQKELVKLVSKASDEQSRSKVEKSLNKADNLKNTLIKTENDIINGDFSTKNDLPSSYSRDEVKLYQRIIKTIDENVESEIAKLLRQKIKEELSKGKKKK